MPHNPLPLEALPLWCRLNGVTFNDVKIALVEGRGMGIVAERDLVGGEDLTPLITIPKELILSKEMVHEYAKEDKNFHKLLDAVDDKLQTDRENILLFLLVQLVIASKDNPSGPGHSNPWTDYVRFLPADPPIPTLWSERESALLGGTSLEYALVGKLSALGVEYRVLKDVSSDIPEWFAQFWEHETVAQMDWLLVDAWFRSRSFELANGQTVMVPCIDMANHSSTAATAQYEINNEGDIVLYMPNGCRVSKGDEITINYGSKPAPEMIFNYGFFDPDSNLDRVVLPFDPLPDDPLGKAKMFVFQQKPTVTISRDPDRSVRWECPFAYLACLNEEDGLRFRVLQETDGSQELKMYWQDVDVTDKAATIEILSVDHEYYDVFKYRMVTLVAERIQSQLSVLHHAAELEVMGAIVNEPSQLSGHLRQGSHDTGMAFRSRETILLQEGKDLIAKEETELKASDSVAQYFEEIQNRSRSYGDDPA